MLESQCWSVGFQESATGGMGDGMCGGGGAGAAPARAVGGGGGLCWKVDGGGVGACGGGVCCDGGVYGGITYGLEWWTWCVRSAWVSGP